MEGDADSFMTSLNTDTKNPHLPPLSEHGTNQPHKAVGDAGYAAQREEIEKKFGNLPEEKTSDNNKEDMEFSSPIDDVMAPPPAAAPAPPMDPRMMEPQQPMMMAPPPQDVQMAPEPPKASSNVGGLTDEQMDALLVAAIVAILMSPQAQEKLINIAPQFAERNAIGLGLTGLVGAGLFFGAKKFILKN